MNPTRAVSLGIGAFAVIGVLGVVAYGEGDTVRRDAGAQAPRQLSPGRAEVPSRRAQASAGDYESWANGSASEFDDAPPQDDGASQDEGGESAAAFASPHGADGEAAFPGAPAARQRPPRQPEM